MIEKTLMIVFVVLLLCTGICLSDDTAFIADSGDCRYPAVATEANSIFMAWLVTEARPINLYFQRSIDEGNTWSSARKISKENGDCMPPSIAVNSGIVHLAWVDCGEVIDGELNYTRSHDSGTSWEKNTILVENVNSAQYPLISCSGNNVYLIWQDVQTKVHFKVSHDKGVTWEKETLLGEVGKQSCYCFPPALSVSGSNVTVVWTNFKENKTSSDRKIFGLSLFKANEDKRIASVVCKKSFDDGRTWKKEQILTSTQIPKEMKDEIDNPSMFTDGSRSYLFWQDKHELPLGEILFTRFDHSAKKRRISGKKLFPAPKRSPKCPSVVFDNDKNLHLTWTTFFGGESMVHYGEIDSSGIILKEKMDLTSHAGHYQNPALARTSSGLLHLFWFTKPKDKKIRAKIYLATSKDNGATWHKQGLQNDETQK